MLIVFLLATPIEIIDPHHNSLPGTCHIISLSLQPSTKTQTIGQEYRDPFYLSCSSSLCCSQQRAMQIYSLEINSGREETSHSVHEYPEQDNGDLVPAAVSCSLNISTCRWKQSMLVNGQLPL